ncbi:MAG: hypothetical protein FWB86_11895 [Treponema sp.]|nr:hypothetical protein [Treponema sp.]
MGNDELTGIAGFTAIAMSVIGFITVWIKFGHERGRNEEMIKALERKTEENKTNIAKMEANVHGLELRIAEFMGELRVKFDFIKETVAKLEVKGGSRAAKK